MKNESMKAPGATLPLACSCHMSPHVSQRVVTLDESRLSAEIFETDLSVVTTPFSFSKNSAGIRLCGVIFFSSMSQGPNFFSQNATGIRLCGVIFFRSMSQGPNFFSQTATGIRLCGVIFFRSS